jgi:VCBS repeat-containing protein
MVGDQVYNENFTVKAADGTTSSITVAITGTNDAAVLSTGTATLTEGDTGLSASGQLSISDVDSAATFQPATLTGSYGSLSIGEDGKWTYTAGANNQMVGDQVYNENFTVKAADGTTSSITVAITGTNDAAVLSTGTSTLNETNAPLNASGKLSISDVDSSQTFIAETGKAGLYGTFNVDAGGNWSYAANSANNQLNTNDKLTDTFVVSSADGTLTSVTVNIVGTNDAAIITGSSSARLYETNAIQSTGGQLYASDLDNAANSFIAQDGLTGTNGFGKFSIDSDGTWTYTMITPNNQFVAGKEYSDSATVRSEDGTTKVVTVNMIGSNDAASISGTSTAGLTETNAVQTASGKLNIADVDEGQNVVVAQTGVTGDNGYGKFTVAADGKWSYTMTTAHNEFNAGSTHTDSVLVTSADGTASKVLSVTITGTNDAASISGTYTASMTEDTEKDVSGWLTVTDLDAGEASFQAVTTPTASSKGYGEFTVGANGNWVYSLDNNNATVNALKQGTNTTDTFTVKAFDGTTRTVTITISGTTDAQTDVVEDGVSSSQITGLSKSTSSYSYAVLI